MTKTQLFIGEYWYVFSFLLGVLMTAGYIGMSWLLDGRIQ